MSEKPTLLETFEEEGFLVLDSESEAQTFAGELIWQQLPFVCIIDSERDIFYFTLIRLQN